MGLLTERTDGSRYGLGIETVFVAELLRPEDATEGDAISESKRLWQ